MLETNVVPYSYGDGCLGQGASAMVGAMFIRRTQTRRTEDGNSYFSHRLVHAERLGSTVRQRTLLNLGRHFDIPQADGRIPDFPEQCVGKDGL